MLSVAYHFLETKVAIKTKTCVSAGISTDIFALPDSSRASSFDVKSLIDVYYDTKTLIKYLRMPTLCLLSNILHSPC